MRVKIKSEIPDSDDAGDMGLSVKSKSAVRGVDAVMQDAVGDGKVASNLRNALRFDLIGREGYDGKVCETCGEDDMYCGHDEDDEDDEGDEDVGEAENVEDDDEDEFYCLGCKAVFHKCECAPHVDWQARDEEKDVDYKPSYKPRRR